MSEHVDYMIVGAGLAGTQLARALLERGRSVMVFDHPSPSSSSRVAGGLMNPLTGKRLAWDADFDVKLDRARSAYEDVPGALRMLPLTRFLSEPMEQASWHKKKEQFESATPVREYAPEIFVPESALQPALSQLPALRVPHAAVLDTAHVIEHRQRELIRKGVLRQQMIRLEGWDASSHELGGVHAQHIVFCEGWNVSSHPLFAAVAMMCARGQLLTVRIDACETIPEIIVHQGRFLIPLGDHLFRFGATYEWNDLHENVDESATEFLCDLLACTVRHPFAIVDVRAGVRPIVRDLQPVVGTFPGFPHVSILNGMGSKGALLAPTLVPMLIDHMEHGSPIPEHQSVERWYE